MSSSFYKAITQLFPVLEWPDPTLENLARVKKSSQNHSPSARVSRAFLNSRNIPACLDQAIQTRKPSSNCLVTIITAQASNMICINFSFFSKVGCIDARYLATYHASTMMFSSGDNQRSIGSKWVQWSLPEGRESDSLWTHSIGHRTVKKAKMHRVTVKAWNGNTKV